MPVVGPTFSLFFATSISLATLKTAVVNSMLAFSRVAARRHACISAMFIWENRFSTELRTATCAAQNTSLISARLD